MINVPDEALLVAELAAAALEVVPTVPASRPGSGGKDDSAWRSKSGAGLVALLLTL